MTKLAPWSDDSVANDVSANGSVVVGQSTSFSPSNAEAWRWTAAAGMVGLGQLPGGVFGSSASDVSADGLVVVGQSDSALGTQAFRWDVGPEKGLIACAVGAPNHDRAVR